MRMTHCSLTTVKYKYWKNCCFLLKSVMFNANLLWTTNWNCNHKSVVPQHEKFHSLHCFNWFFFTIFDFLTDLIENTSNYDVSYNLNFTRCNNDCQGFSSTLCICHKSCLQCVSGKCIILRRFFVATGHFVYIHNAETRRLQVRPK